MLLKLLITIDFDPTLYYEDDYSGDDGKYWFYKDVLSHEDNNLALNSKELGDAIGEVIACEVLPDSKSELKRVKIQKGG